MNYEQIVGYYGGLTKAANDLGVDRRRVHAWKARGVPSFWQVKVEALTDGDLKADKKAKQKYAELLQFCSKRPARQAA